MLDEDEAILFQQHLDRHNENHLIALVGENNIPELPNDEDIILEYQENVEDDGNNEFYDRYNNFYNSFVIQKLINIFYL